VSVYIFVPNIFVPKMFTLHASSSFPLVSELCVLFFMHAFLLDIHFKLFQKYVHRIENHCNCVHHCESFLVIRMHSIYLYVCIHNQVCIPAIFTTHGSSLPLDSKLRVYFLKYICLFSKYICLFLYIFFFVFQKSVYCIDHQYFKILSDL